MGKRRALYRGLNVCGTSCRSREVTRTGNEGDCFVVLVYSEIKENEVKHEYGR